MVKIFSVGTRRISRFLARFWSRDSSKSRAPLSSIDIDLRDRFLQCYNPQVYCFISLCVHNPYRKCFVDSEYFFTIFRWIFIDFWTVFCLHMHREAPKHRNTHFTRTERVLQSPKCFILWIYVSAIRVESFLTTPKYFFTVFWWIFGRFLTGFASLHIWRLLNSSKYSFCECYNPPNTFLCEFMWPQSA